MVEFKVVIKNNFGGSVDAIKTVVTEKKYVELEVSSFLFSFDVRQSSLQ